MRYRETGEVHLEFHRTTNGTIRYLRETFGRDFLDQTLRRTATDVYRSLHEDLKKDDWDQLVEHWSYFMEREGGDFELEKGEDFVKMTVKRCPAIAWLMENRFAVDPDFCRATEIMNSTWAEGTPFHITTEVLGDGRCVQTIRRKTT